MVQPEMLKWKRTALFQVELLLLFLSCLTGCSQDNTENILFQRRGYTFPYRLAEPVQSWKLPDELVEISGLSFIDSTRLACVQDELGIIYIFNLRTGKVESQIEFNDKGDYEGIEIIENDAWILESNGTLYHVAGYLKSAEPAVKKYPTALSRKNDTEGLAYDPVTNNLLIACKGYPYLDETTGMGLRAIYSFNLETKRIDLKPFLLVNMDTIKYYRNYNKRTRLGVDLQAFSNPSQGDVIFAPSGMAVHPVSGDVFILGSVGKLLLVFSKEGEMLAMIKLRPEHFPKPEGICFSPDGKLCISNEGDGRAGTIFTFESGK